MTEADLSQELMASCRANMRGAVVMKHADRFNTGVPDISITWNGMTSWWEVKFWNMGDFDAPPLQNIICQRLASQGLCRYIIFEQTRKGRRVLVVPPKVLGEWRETFIYAHTGFDYLSLALYIKTQHVLKGGVNV